ncbi:MAG: PadR family transcriptional regulator [archaeon]|nr:PadR family transcriptional regulator [archaeon]MCP8314281.1 PadR family transcriptional regulator [archaeon]MCP8316432.1 PadR family transcriptional regulator [archaeon]MCP8321075.1 PadR family transcriptional regulator [archaeon]
MIGVLNIIILFSLKNEPRSGYDLICIIHDKFNALISPGTVYPILTNLEKEGLIKGEPDINGRKKLYNLTRKGEKTLHSALVEYEEFASQIKLMCNSAH